MFHLYLFPMIISQQLDHRPLGAPCGVVPLRGFLQPLVPVLGLRGGRFLETKPPNLGEVPLFSWKKMMDVLHKFSFDQLGVFPIFQGSTSNFLAKWCKMGKPLYRRKWRQFPYWNSLQWSWHTFFIYLILAVSNQKCLSSQVIPAVSTLTFYPYIPHLYPMDWFKGKS